MRVDNIRCRNKPSCDNRRDGEGSRDPNANQKAFELQDKILQDIEEGVPWGDIKRPVEKLMALRLCMKHQPLSHEAVRCTMDLLACEYDTFQPKHVNTRAQKVPEPLQPPQTDRLHPTSNIQIKQESGPKPQPLSALKPQAPASLTPPSFGKNIPSNNTYQFSLPSVPGQELANAKPSTPGNSTDEKEARKFDFDFGVSRAPGRTLTPPGTPEHTKSKTNARDFFSIAKAPKEALTSPITPEKSTSGPKSVAYNKHILPERPKEKITPPSTPEKAKPKNTTSSTEITPDTTISATSATPMPTSRCSRSPVSRKVEHHFSDYPHTDTRSSVLDELLDNFEALEIRAEKLEQANKKLQDENDALRARCKALETKN